MVGIPNVYVGRIPASNGQEAQSAINKIIGYQQQRIYNPSSTDWAHTFLFASGTDSGDGITNTGSQGHAVLNDYIQNMSSSKNTVKMYQEYSNLSTNQMTSELNNGALFLNVAAHGSPGTGIFLSPGWLFYWVSPYLMWYNGYGTSDVKSLTNNYRLPVVTTMSCSTAALDSSSHSFGEVFVLTPNGGSIAYMGATRTAYSAADDAQVPYYYCGAIDSMIYQTFNQGQTRVGQLWAGAITSYSQSFISNYQNAYWVDAKTLMEYILLGDPTIDASGDFTPPVTQASYDSQWHNQNFYVQLTPTDIGKGTAETYYQINNGTTERLSIDGQPLITQESANNTLTYWSVDKAGNAETPKILTNIKLDKTPPDGAIIINNNATYSTQTNVKLNLTAADSLSGVSQIRLSNDSTFNNSTWEASVLYKDWNLTNGDGLKTVYYQIMDLAGLISNYSNSIMLDTTPPQGTVVIDNGQSYTNNLTVSLTLSAVDPVSGVNQMCFSNDALTWSNWEPYHTTKSWAVLSGDGTKNVYVQYQNNAGLASTTLSTISLDTVTPIANAGLDQTVYVGTKVSFDASKSTDNIGIITYSWNFGDQSNGNGIAPTHTFMQSEKYTVTLIVYDVAGNNASSSISVNVQPQPSPTPSPSPSPSASPTPSPSPSPTLSPTPSPSPTPTPTSQPTTNTTATPTTVASPTSSPLPTPSPAQTSTPTSNPTQSPTTQPTPIAQTMGDQTLTLYVATTIGAISAAISIAVLLVRRRNA